MWFKMLAKLSRQNRFENARLNKRKMSRKARSACESLEPRNLFSFTAPVPYAAGIAPVSMISGDFNGDGRPDVLTSNSFPAVVTTLLGNGDGTFGAAISSPLVGTPGSSYTGSQAGTLATGDYNHDGKLDVAVISGQNVVTLLGNGDGSFQPGITTFAGSSPARISSADVNADGFDDLLAANTAGTVSILLSKGDGTFAAPATYAAGPDAQDVKAADINHDGKLDLMVANAVSAGSVSTLMGNGDGTFQPYTSYAAFSAPYRMDIADYNGDGNMDVGVANSYTSSCVTILMGNPDGTFQPYHSYDTGSQPWELESKDVNGDGLPDMIDSNGSSYEVEINNGDGTFGVTSTFAGAGWVFAANDFNGDGTADIAGANSGSVGVLINNSVAATHISTTTGFTVNAPASTVAGTSTPLTLSAVDADGNIVTDFTGTVHVSSTDARMPSFNYTFVAGDLGTHTISNFSLYTAGTQTVTATGPAALTGSRNITVSAASAGKFSIVADATDTAGNAVSYTVTAQDLFGNLASDYTGSLHFTSNDPQAILPPDFTFSAADAGTHAFSAVLKTSGIRAITATDTVTPSIRGSSASIMVAASDPVRLSLIGGGGHIGSPHFATVTALDAFGNVATGYNGTIHLTASDTQLVLPADGALIAGVGTFAVTPMTLGAQTLSAIDTATGALFGTETISGTPGDAARFVMSPLGNVNAGGSQNVTITAYDAFGNIAVDYAGTINFSSTDLQASLPYYTFTAADTGTHTFSVTLRTAGAQAVTATDIYNPSITATQAGINVTAGVATSVSTTLLHDTVAGVAQSFTVTARDAFGNIATSYRGTINMVSSDTQAILPATYTFTAADAGTHTFSMTFKSSGGQTFDISDSTGTMLAVSQRDIHVNAAAVAGFSFRTPSNVAAGTAFSVTLSAVDAFGNVIAGYTGKVHFSGPSGGGNLLPLDYTFTAADAGVHVFSVTFSSTGTLTLGVQDLVTPSLKGSTSITVKASGGSGGGGGGGTATGGGATGGGGGGGGGGGKKVV